MPARHGGMAFSLSQAFGPGGDVGDQKRVVTAAQAMSDGASVLVIGRPITGAANPVHAIEQIAATLNTEQTRKFA